jgi:hypothetical protein
VHALRSRVAILNNGTRKGGQPDAMKVIYSAPGLEDLWQIHFSLLSGQEYTVPGMFIANTSTIRRRPCRLPPCRRLRPTARAAATGAQRCRTLHQCQRRPRSFTVTNSRNGFSKIYAAVRGN